MFRSCVDYVCSVTCSNITCCRPGCPWLHLCKSCWKLIGLDKFIRRSLLRKKERNGGKQFTWWHTLACGALTNSGRGEKESISLGFQMLGGVYRANRDQGKSFIHKQSALDKTPWQKKKSYCVINTFFTDIA